MLNIEKCCNYANLAHLYSFGHQKSLKMGYSPIWSTIRVAITSCTWPVPMFPLYFEILQKTQEIH